MASARPAPAKTATKPAPIVTGLNLDQVMHHLVAAHTTFETVVKREQLPLVWDSELAFARDKIMRDSQDKLRMCEPRTLTEALQNLAHVGLTLNPLKNHATLIARWNDALKVLECQSLIMYRGLVYLATQAGVHDIECDVVYKADGFKIGRDRNGGYVEHDIAVTVPREGENHFLGMYVMAIMPGSASRKVEWVPAEDIYRMRDQSDSFLDKEGKPRPGSPWVRWFDEQAKKSGIKRASKRWEEAIDHGSKWQRFQQAVQMDHDQERGGRTLEGEATPVETVKLSLEQITQIESGVAEIFHGPESQQTYLRKVCNAYGVEVLADVPGDKFKEITERIQMAQQQSEKKRQAKGAKK
jgi:recombinational DNA repair protein RecT